MGLQNETERFLANLVVRNNTGNEDEGVNKVLKNLKDVSLKENISNLKKDKEVKKEQLVAGLAFLRGSALDDVKSDLNKLKVDDLRTSLVERFEHIRPNTCDKCNTVYMYHTDEEITY